MRRVKGRRYDNERKLNIKKVIAFIIAVVVLIMVFVSLKHLLSTGREGLTKEVSTLTTYISVYENNKWGVIDNKGNKIIEPTYDEMIIIPNKNEDVFICTYDVDYTTGTYKTKVINEKGKKILEDYNLVEVIENSDNNNVWYEKDVLRFEKDGKYGLIDYDGKIILDPEYSKIEAMAGTQNNLILDKDGKIGVYNIATNDVVIESLYKEIRTLTEDYSQGYVVKDEQDKLGLIAADKKQILDCKYAEIKGFTDSNCYVVVEEGKLELIDEKENVLLDSGFDTIEGIHSDNIVIVEDGKYGIIKNKGESVISPEYESLEYAFEDYYIAGKDGKKGLIDLENNIKIDFNYETMSYVEEANLLVADKDLEHTDVINSMLEIVLKDIIVSELNTEYGYLRVRSGEEYKYYNFKLEEKTNIEMLSTNTLFLIKENGKYGYVNKNGEKIVNPIYDDAKEQNSFGYCAVKKDGLWGVLKSDGTVILEPSINLDEYLLVDFIADYYRYNDLKLNVYTK